MYYNFRVNDYAYTCPDVFNKEFKDKRNGFDVMRPTMDIPCYINYLKLLNSLRDKWVDYGYMDIGLLPLFMAPSFMHQILLPTVIDVLSNQSIPYIIMPAVSFMKTRCERVYSDLWINRKFVCDYCGSQTMYGVSVIQFLEEVFKDVIS